MENSKKTNQETQRPHLTESTEKALTSSYMLHYFSHMLVDFELNSNFVCRNPEEVAIFTYLFNQVQAPFTVLQDGTIKHK